MRSVKAAFLFLILFNFQGCVFVNIPGVEPLSEKTLSGRSGPKVLLMDISGVIKDDDGQSVLGIETRPNITARIKEELTKAAEDSEVKAVVLRINSPGGSVTASDIISHEIKAFRKKTGVPVIAELMDVAASGGYYIAASADRIIASPTTVTGSIGVVAFSVNAKGLLDKIGIADQTIKSGDMKDIGTPMRAMTDEERRILQSVIDGMYGRFLDQVIEGRPKIDRKRLKTLADGRVFTAGQALDAGLIDSIGYLDDAVEEAKRAAGLEQARVVAYAPARSYRNNIYSMAPQGSGINIINLDNALTRRFGLDFMYIWMP